jgi:hypothetical protein
MVDGIFHDACEVYATDAVGTRKWVGTMATRELAEMVGLQFETLGYAVDIESV